MAWHGCFLLRTLERMPNEENTGVDSMLHAQQVVPQLILERLSKLLLNDDYISTLQSFGLPKPITFRPNTIRTSEHEVLNDVTRIGLKSTPVSWCPLCHQLLSGTIRELQELPTFLDNGIYIQAASSMLAVHALKVKPELRVLDLCAAPGSKTSQLAAIMENSGILVANDRSRKRLFRLREILQRLGATNVEVLCGQGERLGRTHADCFDRVLVDAPCSGESRIRLDRPIRLSRWNMQEIRRLARLQEQLLTAALRCVKVGGLVVYSTCTFAPEENEFVLDKVLRKKTINSKVIALPKALTPPSSRPPITSWNNKEVTQDITGSLRIIPDETTTGFFIACLQRTA